MIRRFLHIASCALLLTCSHSGPTNIYDTEALRPSRHEEEFIDGEIQCTGHMLEDNFEDNLASAAAKMDVVCLSNLGLYTDYVNPATGTEGNTMVFACTYGAVEACNSIRFFELNPRFDEVCPGQGAWMFNATNDASYGRDPAKTVECWA